jgi:hypothetical protein
MSKPLTSKSLKTYYIKVNLFKDGTPLWHGVTGEAAIKPKIAELRKLGYKPRLDRSLSETD